MNEALESSESLKEKAERYIKKAHYTKRRLCEEIGIDERTLRRYLNEYEGEKVYPLPRNIAIAIALTLKLTLDETNSMFAAAMTEHIPSLNEYDKYDRIIIEAIEHHYCLTTVNERLRNSGYMPLT